MTLFVNTELELSFEPRSGTSAAGRQWSSAGCKTTEEQDNRVSFVKLSAFDQNAEQLAKLQPGARIRVKGRVQIDRYISAEGVQKSQMAMIADELQVLSFVERTAPLTQDMAEDSIPY